MYRMYIYLIYLILSIIENHSPAPLHVEVEGGDEGGDEQRGAPVAAPGIAQRQAQQDAGVLH